ncbi:MULTISPECIES: citrate lyase holo-[acyl-carrier protein] synthase [unclassified Klebsiella]|uniref:citrate lyase holo-[acyl-carrier protein] synthase n=1 Tax=Enterobacteriaceae TaxID=543 RepID=UPI0015DD49A9|nr:MULTISPECIES: citrate lyase holo-[acyl-carrier protein] synthase [unclassified Klebsiella]HAT3954495.1 citrate lyase holo-[acyl-carrier protein] synthase [Kluyvera ascorbata]BBR57476.1 phosphoribosyl-dephospho-CoA transferase [Klebsiella sp. WP4-W18-ESBL-05]BBS90242.1 phosphoribosyl-dephospho-CoA transferase [Klebsiella sp. WP7-S18-CRE-02]BBS95264.1 phosphoribosyl-dephospho-CoA transferase [Klebsiella sp. WP7-S18-CRE-03]BBT00296.1 phosphoribosyl-dephospho-CoA transferase [Klebsiella sp. WP7
MTTATPVSPGVSLEALLAAKESRAARQADWLTHYGQPVISLTLVTPGAVKNNLRYRNTMGVALQMCDQMLWQNDWQVLDRQVLWLPTGPEALWCVGHQAPEIKAHCAALEQSHPLGRLWDLDVICPHAGHIGRLALGRHMRRCLICDEPAHVCSRSRQHPLEQVIGRVEALIDGWFIRD